MNQIVDGVVEHVADVLLDVGCDAVSIVLDVARGTTDGKPNIDARRPELDFIFRRRLKRQLWRGRIELFDVLTRTLLDVRVGHVR